MSVIIDGDTGIDKITDGSVVQADLASGVAGTGPAFSAYMGSNQSVTQATATKCTFNTEAFDTNSNYDTGTYRFTPTVAGYYQVNAQVYWLDALADQKQTWIAIYKNGSNFTYGSIQNASGNDNLSPTISNLVYLNGSSDYIEIYARQGDTASKNLYGSSGYSWFTAHLARAA